MCAIGSMIDVLNESVIIYLPSDKQNPVHILDKVPLFIIHFLVIISLLFCNLCFYY